uniref:E3 ubiquitin protein ligase n=1 Tax=Angiostrongylus cantonensis TaxID=6313 RepID=A0A0K0DIH0_ANGCA
MSKRSLSDNSDGSDQDDSHSNVDDREIAAKKRRLVAFETVRLLSVTGVNDIDDKKAKVQAYKLSEALRHKNKQLKTKEREIERLRQRQITDENTSCTINRHWNNLDEQLRLIALRGASSEEVEELLECNDEAVSGDFLDEIVQMEGVQGEHVYDKRVQQSVRLFEKVMMQLARKSDHYRAFSKKLISIFDASTLSGEDRDEALHGVVAENERLAEETSRLQREANRAQQKYARSSLKLKECEDQIAQLTTRNEELARELEEAKFDLDKAQRQVNKLDYKLYTLVKDNSANCEIRPTRLLNGLSNGGGMSDSQLDELRAESELNAELAGKRLQEIHELNERIQKFVEDTVRMEYFILFSRRIVPQLKLCRVLNTKIWSSSIQSLSMNAEGLGKFSNSFVTLKFSLSDYEAVTEERDLLRQEMLQKVEDMKADEHQSMRKMRSLCEQITRDLNQMKTESDMLRMEFEQSLAAHSKQDAKQQDIKVLFGTLKTQNYQLNSDVAKYRKKWKEGVNTNYKIQTELDSERRRLERCLVIEMDDEDSNELASPDQSRDDFDVPDDINGERISMVTNSQKLLVRERRLKRENERLLHQIKRLGNIERKERMRYFEMDANRLFSQKDNEIERLKREVAMLKDTEASLMLDLDNTGSALEELQEQNAKLISLQKENDEGHIKMMNDRIIATQLQVKIKEEMVAHLESQVNNLTRQIAALQCEKESQNEALKLALETIGVKTKENVRQNRIIETLRKQLTEQSLNTADLTTRSEKIGAQLRDIQEVVASKTLQLEVIDQRKRRLEEENSTLRKRLERAKKSEKLGSTDAVLMEEIRELKTKNMMDEIIRFNRTWEGIVAGRCQLVKSRSMNKFDIMPRCHDENHFWHMPLFMLLL